MLVKEWFERLVQVSDGEPRCYTLSKIAGSVSMCIELPNRRPKQWQWGANQTEASPHPLNGVLIGGRVYEVILLEQRWSPFFS